jgi:hypothetical protein
LLDVVGAHLATAGDGAHGACGELCGHEQDVEAVVGECRAEVVRGAVEQAQGRHVLGLMISVS